MQRIYFCEMGTRRYQGRGRGKRYILVGVGEAKEEMRARFRIPDRLEKP